MVAPIGIRLEDKSRWERRAPLIPEHVAWLIREEGIPVIVQPSPIRIFPDEEYRAAGATLSEDLSPCGVIFAVKEIPKRLLLPDKTYVFFSHTIKRQPYNMPMLARLLELGCTLIDYELVKDSAGRRLIFFGRHAGLAGMLDTLWALGQRLEIEGWTTPFSDVLQAYRYTDLAEAKAAIRSVGARLEQEGLPSGLGPLVFGFTGYGNVSRGAQEIFDLLPHTTLEPQELLQEPAGAAAAPLIKVVFKEEHLVLPREPGKPFILQEYYDHPERYRGRFADYLDRLHVLVNCIYWTERYPRLVTRDQVRRLYERGAPRLRVIGDISCDIEGSIEITLKPTQPDAPVYVYDVDSARIRMGVEGHGPVVMAVDNLPCELPREASVDFSTALRPFVPAIARADTSVPFEQYAVPPEIKQAVIAYRGKLTPPFEYLA